jgi:Xaa-Pro aminopeptidase
MAYYELQEHGKRIERFAKYLDENNLDFALVYYDETNVANGWYLTAWCPQFESGCVLVSRTGKALILGGPESEPFARQDSAVKETRNLPVFMVPDEEYPNAEIISFGELFKELSQGGAVKKAGIAGMDSMPYAIYKQISANFDGVELIDITGDFLKYREVKSGWERAQMQKAFDIAFLSYEKMAEQIAPDKYEYEIAAAGEYIARVNGASSFAFKAIVGSGLRANAVVPTASDKKICADETVIIGLAPRYKGYSGVIGHTLPASGYYTKKQGDAMKCMQDVFVMTRDALKPGITGKEIDAFGRDYFIKHGYMKYLVCPFAHTIGLMEAEAPFFGPGSADVLVPGMTVCVDVSFFGHPELGGARIETGYEITADGARAFSPAMEKILLSEIKVK